MSDYTPGQGVRIGPTCSPQPAPAPTPDAANNALTSYILRSALTYSAGSWSGQTVAEDMVQSAGITADEIDAFTTDKAERRKLKALLRKHFTQNRHE